MKHKGKPNLRIAKLLERAALMLILLLIPLLAVQKVAATCFSGWIFKVDNSLPSLFLLRGFKTTRNVTVTIKATALAGATACSLLAWSKISGVGVTWGTGAPTDISPTSIDVVVFRDGGMTDFNLFIAVDSSASGDGVIEIRYSTSDVQAIEDTTLIGVIALHFGMLVPTLSEWGTITMGSLIALIGVFYIRRRKRSAVVQAHRVNLPRRSQGGN